MHSASFMVRLVELIKQKGSNMPKKLINKMLDHLMYHDDSLHHHNRLYELYGDEFDALIRERFDGMGINDDDALFHEQAMFNAYGA